MKYLAKIAGIIILIVVVAWVIQLMCCNRYRLSKAENPFPRHDQIKSVHCRSYDSETEWQADVPPDRFGLLASLFDNARKDPNPLPWEIIAELDVKLKSDRVIHVIIFHISSPPSGFKIDNEYYRGGTIEQFSRFFNRKAFQHPLSPFSKDKKAITPD